jgi:tetratricopeptide (TPR) repeat protein
MKTMALLAEIDNIQAAKKQFAAWNWPVKFGCGTRYFSASSRDEAEALTDEARRIAVNFATKIEAAIRDCDDLADIAVEAIRVGDFDNANECLKRAAAIEKDFVSDAPAYSKLSRRFHQAYKAWWNDQRLIKWIDLALAWRRDTARELESSSFFRKCLVGISDNGRVYIDNPKLKFTKRHVYTIMTFGWFKQDHMVEIVVYDKQMTHQTRAINVDSVRAIDDAFEAACAEYDTERQKQHLARMERQKTEKMLRP